MILLSEDGFKRVYLGADQETWYEVHAEMRGQWATISPDAYAEESVREAIEAQTKAQLAAWFASDGDDLGAEPVRDPMTGSVIPPAVSWKKIRVEWHPGLHALDEETGRYEPVPFFEPFDTWRCTVEQAYWPPEPVDPDIAHGRITPPPPPRASDFRGDWKDRG